MQNQRSTEEVSYTPFLPTQPMEVLLAEDDPYISLFLYEVLHCIDAKVTVDHYQSAEDAIHRMKVKRKNVVGNPYSFVVADIYLSGEATGFDLCRFSQANFPNLPIVVTSIAPHSVFREAYKDQKSIPDYLPKPYSIKECMDFFKTFVSVHSNKPLVNSE